MYEVLVILFLDAMILPQEYPYMVTSNDNWNWEESP